MFVLCVFTLSIFYKISIILKSLTHTLYEKLIRYCADVFQTHTTTFGDLGERERERERERVEIFKKIHISFNIVCDSIIIIGFR